MRVAKAQVGSQSDPRYTIARSHVLRELAATVDDVLGIREIWREIEPRFVGKTEQELDNKRRALAAMFLYSDQHSKNTASEQVYFPVGVTITNREGRPRYRDVSDGVTQPGSAGMVLQSRSGAGKTTAMRRAFCDGAKGVLQFAPAWLNDTEVPSLMGNHGSADAVIDLLTISLLAARPNEAGWGKARQLMSHAVRYGPRIALFVDLNLRNVTERIRLAESLALFQKAHGGRHRVVAAYRWSGQDDAIVQHLRRHDQFEFCDLDALDEKLAFAYLQNLPAIKERAFQQLGAPEPARDPAEEQAAVQGLRDLVGRVSHNVLSTPLLVYFCSILTANQLADVQSPAELYETVERELLSRDQDLYCHAMPDELKGLASGIPRLRLAMVRLALSMLEKESAALSDGDFARAMRTPATILSTALWRQSKYRNAKDFDDDGLSDALSEFTLLRREEGRVRFLHDSFIAYYAAFAMRWHEHPRFYEPLERRTDTMDGEWSKRVTEMMAADPARWTSPGVFLGGWLSAETMRVVVELLLISPEQEVVGPLIEAIISGGGDQICGSCPPDFDVCRALELVDDTADGTDYTISKLLFSEPGLGRVIQFLQEDTGHRLAPLSDEAQKKAVLDELRSRPNPLTQLAHLVRCTLRGEESLRRTYARGLNALTGDPLLAPLRDTLRQHDMLVGFPCLDELRNLISSYSDLTDCRSWLQAVLPRRHPPVSFVAVPGLYAHSCTFMQMAFSPCGSSLATTQFESNEVRIWDVQTGSEVTTVVHEDDVEALAWSSAGVLAVSIGVEDCIQLWETGRLGRISRLGRIGCDDLVSSLKWSPDGQYLIGAGVDGLHIWDIKARVGGIGIRHRIHPARCLHTHYSISRCNSVAYVHDNEIGVFSITKTDLIEQPSISNPRRPPPPPDTAQFLSELGDTGPYENVSSLDFVDEDKLALAHGPSISVCDLTGKTLARLDCEGDFWEYVHYIPRLNMIAAAGDKAIGCWTLDGRLLGRAVGHTMEHGLTSSNDGKLASIAFDSGAFVWKLLSQGDADKVSD